MYMYIYIHKYYVNVYRCSNEYVAAMGEAAEVHAAGLAEAEQGAL